MRKVLFKIQYYLVFLCRYLYSFINGGFSCAICGQKTYAAPLCSSCIHKYFSVKASLASDRCNCCGRKLISTKNECLQCRESKVINNIDYMIPLFSYRLWNKELLFLWKIQGIRSLSNVFAAFVAETLSLLDIKYVVPIPPRPSKIKEQGWDQIDELCKILNYRYGIKVLKLLERKSKIQQKKLDRNERLKTIASAYIMKDTEEVNKILKRYSCILPDKVCLIDDVCTTGATLDFCSDLLKRNGVKSVYAVSLFTVD